MIGVVHGGEVVELTLAESLDGVEEAPVARLVAELLEALLEEGLVVRADRPDMDYRSVPKHGALERNRSGGGSHACEARRPTAFGHRLVLRNRDQ